MSTEAQLKAISNSELASGNQIPALKHRTVNNAIIEEMYDAQSRGDILAGVQTAVSIASGDQVLVIRGGQAYLLDSTEFGFVDALADLTDVSIPAPANDQVLAYNTATSKWEAKDVNNLANVVSISGNATTNTLTKFTGTSSIGDSIISDNGSTVNIAGDLSVNNDLRVGTINSGTSSDFVKGDGSLDSTTYQDTNEKSQANGYAALDSGAKIPLANLPDSILGQVRYQGTWAASTNTPTLANPPASATKGEYYVASDDGTQFGIDFQVGDWIISNGTAWEKVDNTDAVTSVFGRIGKVVANAGDYDEFYVNLDGTQTITGDKTFDNDLTVNGKISLNDGGDSVFIGEEAGLNDDASANRNVGIGYRALQSNTTGFNNTAIGHRALEDNTTGVGNTANGIFALLQNSTANFNTAFGNSALQSNTTGEQNTAVGHVALQGNKTGDGNTAIGYQAGFRDSNFDNNETGNDSVFLGSFTRPLNDGETNQIVIGFGTTGNGSNTVTIGNNFIVETILKGVISGDGSGLTNLDYNNISNPPTLPTDFVSKANGGTFGGDITINANLGVGGNPLASSISGSYQSVSIIDSNVSSLILDHSVAKRFEIASVGVNGGELWFRSGDDNVNAIIIDNSNNTRITGNLAVDTDTLFVDASANRVGIGTDNPSAPLSIDTGTTGTIAQFRGADTDILNIDGDSNAITLDARNVASLNFEMQGSEAMRIDSSGNVGMGESNPSFKIDVNTGSIGGIARFSGADSDDMIFKSESGFMAIDVRNTTSGLSFQMQGNNRMRIDSSGNVGIGTDNPADPFHLAMTNGDIRMDAEINRNHILSRNAGNTDWRDICISSISGQDQLVLVTSGNVGIGTDNPSAKLHVTGDVRASGDAIFGGTISTNNGTNEWELRRAVNEFGLTLFTDRYIWVTIDGVNYALALYSNATFPS